MAKSTGQASSCLWKPVKLFYVVSLIFVVGCCPNPANMMVQAVSVSGVTGSVQDYKEQLLRSIKTTNLEENLRYVLSTTPIGRTFNFSANYREIKPHSYKMLLSCLLEVKIRILI